jgi:type II secretory pathway pseudopilin PulG
MTDAPAPQQPEPEKKDHTRLLLILGGCGGCLVLVGVLLAFIGIPAFMTYIKKSKAMEARSNLSALSQLVEQECQGQGGYAGIAPAGPVPPTPPASSQATGAFASDPGFARVGFAPNPVVYSYAIRPNAAGGVDLVAQGDLDGDGVRSTYTVACDASCHCAIQAMSIMDELE